MPFRYLAFILCLVSQSVWAASPNVLQWSVQRDLDTTYKDVYAALERNRFFVVFEADIQDNLSGFAKRWGEDYNRNQLQGIRAMVFCNGWYANQVSNLEPALLAMCPLHLTIIHKAGTSTVLFVRPSRIAQGSAAQAIASELEAEVSQAVEQALSETGPKAATPKTDGP